MLNGLHQAFGDLVWKSKDIAGEARIVAEGIFVSLLHEECQIRYFYV